MKVVPVLLAVAFAASPAQASEDGQYEAQFANAWAQFRDAFHQSDPAYANADATREALRAFIAAWQRLAARWGDHPPPRYADDADFGPELADVGDAAARAAVEARHDHVAQAHVTLGQIRALLAEMRHKNGLANYTDQLDQFDDKLTEAGDDDLDQSELSPAQFVQLCEQVGVLGYLAERLQKAAPAGLAEDDHFADEVDGLARQVQGLKAAVLNGQGPAVVAALADLRRSFDQFYLHYG